MAYACQLCSSIKDGNQSPNLPHRPRHRAPSAAPDSASPAAAKHACHVCCGGFYQRFGWRPWIGKTYVDGPDGTEPTPEEDGNILILTTLTTGEVEVDAPISCDWRSGDVW